MADNPAQSDLPAKATPGSDTDEKIQNLEREVDLIKTSIKRLLMDIRERMNESENPFVVAHQGTARTDSFDTRSARQKFEEKTRAPPEDRETAPEEEERERPAVKRAAEPEASRSNGRKPVEYAQPYRPTQPASPPPIMDERRIIDEQLLAQFRAQLMGTKPSMTVPLQPQNEKLRLQKVYKLFKWTEHAVKKFGNDRLEIMLTSFQKMGHISKDALDEIHEIARLMPASLGEEHEVGPEEYVSELYTLNRIIAPEDTSLDRDMIEVMMEQRAQPAAAQPPRAMAPSSQPPTIEIPILPPEKEREGEKEKRPSKNHSEEEEWMNLPDRI